MQTKRYLYAAVGAPVVIAKIAQERIEAVQARLTKTARSLSKDTRRQLDEWATEGEKLVGRVADGTAIDELAAKVDLDQVQSQVHKLRDQLEDLLATWRANFRPATEPKPASTGTDEKPTAKTSSAKSTKTTAAKAS